MEKFLLPPEQATYVYNPTQDLVVAQTEGGFERKRRDIANAPAIIDCTWRLSRRDYQYFRAFFNYHLDRGVSTFLIDLLLDQPYLQEFEASFVGNTLLMAEPIGLSFLQEAQLEVKRIEDPETDELILYYYEDLNFFNCLEQLANYDLPRVP